jgi:hypothetical protein
MSFTQGLDFLVWGEKKKRRKDERVFLLNMSTYFHAPKFPKIILLFG